MPPTCVGRAARMRSALLRHLIDRNPVTRPRSFRDPITGDILTLGEELSWLAQRVIRRWSVLLAIQIVTVTVLIFGSWTMRDAWNFGASDLAILIESVVGIALFSQTRRDCVVMRDTRRIVTQMEAALANHERILAQLEEILEHRDRRPEAKEVE